MISDTTRSEVIGSLSESVASDASQSDIEREFFVKDRLMSLIQMVIEPDEVAKTVAYVASPWAAASNGAALRVNGGITPTIV